MSQKTDVATTSEENTQLRKNHLQEPNNLPPSTGKHNDLQKPASHELPSTQQASSHDEDSNTGELDLLDILIKREEHRQQLQLLQDLMLHPALIKLKHEPIPTSSTPEEITQRKKEIQYRIDILQTLLTVTKEELKLLSRAISEKPGK